MLLQKRSKSFKKSLQLSLKRGKNPEDLKVVLDLLVKNQKLPKKYNDHSLSGEYSEYRECHVNPDWLLVYRKTKTHLELYKMGTHSDLFR